MAGDRSPQPSREAWEARKQDIHRWYLTENSTCDEIQKRLEARGFKVSERQIKNRLSEWNFERKKTPHTLYLAMLVVFEHHKSLNIEVQFSVPKREIRMTYSGQKVKKECERVKKRLVSSAEGLTYPSINEALRQLEQEGIVVEPRSLVMQQDHPNTIQLRDGAVSWDGFHYENLYRGYYPTMEVDTEIPNPEGLISFYCRQTETHTTAPEAATQSSLFAYRDASFHHHPYSSESPPTVYTPQSIGTPRSGSSTKTESSPPDLCFSPITLPGIGDNSLPSCKDFARHVADSRAFGQSHLDFSTREMRSKFPIVKVEEDFAASHICSEGDMKPMKQAARFASLAQSFSTCRQREAPYSPSDYGFRGVLDTREHLGSKIKREPLDENNYPSQDSGKQGNSLEAHKLTANRWAAPYYMECISKVPDLAALQRSKGQSMNALREALEHNNQFILPCLSWTMLMLGQTERMQQLVDFLQASCTVIEEQPNFKDSATYAVPFRYAWAWASNNEGKMNSCGNDLKRSYDQIRIIWEEEHPNVFVIAYFYAWDLLRKGKCSEAVEVLTNSLAVCETRMGSHDLLTINCLAVVSRAYGEMGDQKQALRYLRKAMAAIQLLEADEDHAEDHRPILQRFRLSLLGRHADLNFHLEDFPNAEKQFWRAVHLCSKLYGVGSVATWDAVYALKPVLLRTGKEALWKDLQDYMDKGWAYEHSKKWLKDQGKNAPPPPPVPPCLWPFQNEQQTRFRSPSIEDSEMGGFQALFRERVSHDEIHASEASRAHRQTAAKHPLHNPRTGANTSKTLSRHISRSRLKRHPLATPQSIKAGLSHNYYTGHPVGQIRVL